MTDKETLEDVVVKRINDNVLLELHHSTCYSFAEIGAKWQQERMYSEAIEFGKWLDENAQNRAYYQMETMSMEELFQQFKKK